LLVDSGGSGASSDLKGFFSTLSVLKGFFSALSALTSGTLGAASSSFLLPRLFLPKIAGNPLEAVFEADPKGPVVGAGEVTKNLEGAGVVVGVVEAKIDIGFGCSATGVVASISSSFDVSLRASFAVSPRARPKLFPNSDPLFSSLGFSLSVTDVVSGLNVVPRTKGEEVPRALVP